MTFAPQAVLTPKVGVGVLLVDQFGRVLPTAPPQSALML